jgi:hypothetical protein
VDAKELKQSKYRNAQMVTLLYSVVFVGIIFYGYKNLLGDLGVFLGSFVSIILAVFAWAIARFIGNDAGGIRGNIPAFGLLLIISAVGIFNSLMLNLEGKRIFAQRIENAVVSFNNLEVAALAEQKSQGISEKIKEVETIKAALMSEIQSPSNCGRGKFAEDITVRLTRLLVNLKIPSGRVNCKDPENVRQYVDAYTQIIDTTMMNAEWNSPVLDSIIRSARDGRQKLACLSNGCPSIFKGSFGGDSNLANYQALLQDVSVNGNSSIQDLMRVVTPKLEELDGEYTRNVELMGKEAKRPFDLKSTLELDELRSIGELGQIANLIISRINRITTYIYLLLSFSFDWLMVYFFANVMKNNPKIRPVQLVTDSGW